HECVCHILIMFCCLITRRPSSTTLFPYTTLFRSLSSWHTCWKPQTRSNSRRPAGAGEPATPTRAPCPVQPTIRPNMSRRARWPRSEEHTSELQSREDLVCRLLLEKKKVAMCCIG